VAVDGSDTSLRAAAFAVGMARRQHARLAFVYVRKVSGSAAAGAAAASSLAQAQDDIARELRATLETLVGRLGVSAEFFDRSGSPFGEIVRLAGELQADAVVVGASTKAGHRFAGSLALHLVRASRWPVTVVP